MNEAVLKSSKIYTNNPDIKTKRVWVALQLNNPVVRWNVARGIIDSPYNVQRYFDNTIISFFLFSRYFNNKKEMFDLEMKMEEIRLLRYPNKISRLRGLFFFDNREDMETAYLKLDSFRVSTPTEVIVPSDIHYDRYDMNWITYYDKSFPDDWIDKYWQGQICPFCPDDSGPNWECLTYESLVIPDTNLRKEAMDSFSKEDDETTLLLQLAIMGANYGYLTGAVFYKKIQIFHHEHIVPMTYVPVEELIDIYEKSKIDYPENAIAIDNQAGKYPNIAFKIPDFSKFSWCITHNKLPFDCFVFSEEIVFSCSYL